MRAVRPAPLTLLAALALLAILGALFVPDRAQAQAQVLVSNLGQTKTGQSDSTQRRPVGSDLFDRTNGRGQLLHAELDRDPVLDERHCIDGHGFADRLPLVYPCVGDECRAPEKSALYADQPGECRGGRGGDVRRPGRLDAGGGQDVCGGGRLQQEHRRLPISPMRHFGSTRGPATMRTPRRAGPSPICRTPVPRGPQAGARRRPGPRRSASTARRSSPTCW